MLEITWMLYGHLCGFVNYKLKYKSFDTTTLLMKDKPQKYDINLLFNEIINLYVDLSMHDNYKDKFVVPYENNIINI